MTAIRFGRWLAVGALGTVMALGCRHARKQDDCICCDCVEYVQPVPADPTPKKTAAVTMLPAPKEEIVKKEERPDVFYRVVAPGATAGAADMVGTDEMTAEDADKVSIRPGHTPGALWAPVRPSQVQTAGHKKSEPAEASEPKLEIPQTPEGTETVPPIPQEPDSSKPQQ